MIVHLGFTFNANMARGGFAYKHQKASYTIEQHNEPKKFNVKLHQIVQLFQPSKFQKL